MRIWDSYRSAWKCLLLNWRILILLYGFTIGFSFIALGPLSNLIEHTFGERLMLSDMTTRFDYTAIMDMVYQNGSAVALSISAILSFFIIYAMDGLNPLHMVSEEPLIFRFKLLVVLLLAILFFTAIVRDVAHVIIKEEYHKPLITHSVFMAIRSGLSIQFVILSIVNIFFLLLGCLLYLLLKQVLQSGVILIVISQIFFMYRLAYRFVRIASFNYQYIDTKDAPQSDNLSSGDKA